MIPCISQATTLSSSFADDIENYAGRGLPADRGVADQARKAPGKRLRRRHPQALADRGVSSSRRPTRAGCCCRRAKSARRTSITSSGGSTCASRSAIPHARAGRRLRRGTEPQSLGRAVVSLAQAGQWAAGFGVRLALEFRGRTRSAPASTRRLSLVEQCGEPNVGVCLDLFHYYKGPSKPEDLDRLTAANLFHVQVCDVAGVPRELMTDADRVMPGDGDFHLRAGRRATAGHRLRRGACRSN